MMVKKGVSSVQFSFQEDNSATWFSHVIFALASINQSVLNALLIPSDRENSRL